MIIFEGVPKDVDNKIEEWKKLGYEYEEVYGFYDIDRDIVNASFKYWKIKNNK